MTTPSPNNKLTSQQIFLDAAEDVQNLIKAVLRDERDVMHLKRRPKIHQKILDHVKRVVK